MVSESSKWGSCAFSTILLLLLVFDAEVGQTDGARPFCGEKLLWVPHVTKKPYISFLNRVHCPSWTTKHFITKENHNTDITLPRGLPFSFFCGVCYRPSSDQYKVTLSHSIRGNQGKVLTNAVNVNDTGLMEHRKRDHECQIVYGLTDYLEESGELTCSASFGQKIMNETVNYSMDEPDVLKANESVIVSTFEQKVTLTCPGVQTEVPSRDPIVHVWFHPMSGKVAMAAPTNSPSATFQLHSEPLIVACATYHLYKNWNAFVTTFVVGTKEFINASPESLATGGNQADWSALQSRAPKSSTLADLLLISTVISSILL